jgi:hypothetical protein
MQFINTRIDSLTMKLFCYTLNYCKMETLKFTSNLLTPEELEILLLQVKKPISRIKKLFIDWNWVPKGSELLLVDFVNATN